MGQSRRKLYFALLGLAAVGLLIDRFVLAQSATAPSVASAGIPLPSLAAAGIKDESASLSTSIPEIPFPRGLQTAENMGPIFDLFARPDIRLRAKMSAELSHNQGSRQRGAGSPARLRGTQFKIRHTLGGVLVHEGLKMAVVDGRPVRIGASIDGCRLTEVSGYEAQFECEDGPVVLELEDVGTHSPD